MLYDKYYQKTLKRAHILSVIKRFRVLIITVSATLIALTAAFFGVFGLVYDKVDCPLQIAYGQSLDYKAGAVFQDVRYEYAAADSSEWSSTPPREVGAYKVRSVSKNIFGKERYGEEHLFTIAPQTVDVFVAEESILYGETPTVKAELFYGDTISCSEFFYDDLSKTATQVVADKQSVQVLSVEGKDVTHNYDLQCQKSDVSFTKRDLVITVADKAGVYNGKKLTFEQYEVSKDTPLAWNDKTVAVFNDYQIDVGQTENTPEIKVINGGVDVTANYNVKLTAGKLSVEKSAIYITAGSGKKVYDGTPIFSKTFIVEKGEVVEGQKIIASTDCRQTNVGSKENLMTFAFMDGEVDVSNNYSVILVPGTLQITSRAVEFTSGDGSWDYDGSIHSNTEIKIAEDSQYQIVEGESFLITSTTEAQNAGTYNNEFSVQILRGDEDVSQNYALSYACGTLEISPLAVTVKTGDGAWVYDGVPHSTEEITLVEGALASGETLSAGDLASVTNAETLKNTTTAVIFRGDKDSTKNYEITYQQGDITVTPRPVTFRSLGGNHVYDGQAYFVKGHELTENSLPLVAGHDSVATSWTEITEVEQKDNALTIEIFQGETPVTDNYLVSYDAWGKIAVTQRTVWIKTVTSSWVYDDSLHGDDGHEVVLLEGGYDLVAGHESKAVPESNAMVRSVSEGEVSNKMEVEIYEGERKVTFNYDLRYQYGKLQILPRPVIFKTGSNSFVYDGEYHFERACTISEKSAYPLVVGHEEVVVADTKIKNVKETAVENNALTVEIYRGTVSEENKVTDNYALSYEKGTLTVTPRPVTFQTNTSSHVYDGQAYSDGGHEIKEGTLVAGHTHGSSNLTQITDVLYQNEEVSSVDNRMQVDVYSSEGKESDNYAISYDYGKLKVTPRPVTFQTNTSSHVYDDTPYKDNGNTLIEGSLVRQHYASVSNEATITDVGSVSNTMDISIKNSGGADKTPNYAVTYAYGKIEVTPRPITVISNGSKIYDGEHFYSNALSVSGDGLVSGHEITAETYQTDKSDYAYEDVGKYANEIVKDSVVITKDNKAKNVTKNYEITRQTGTLNISPRPLCVKAQDDVKIYDGEKYKLAPDFFEVQVVDGYDPSLVKNHTLSATVVEASTGEYAFLDKGKYDVKIQENSVAIKEGERKVNHNYKITTKQGKITILARKFTLTTGSSTWVYDDTAHYDYTYEGERALDGDTGLVGSDQVTATGFPTISEVKEGRKLNKPTTVKVANSVRDVTHNYEVVYNCGYLQITPRPITITTSSDEWIYDGQEHYNETYEVEALSENRGLLVGHTVLASEFPRILDVGKIENKPTVDILKKGVSVKDNYQIYLETGTLEIKSRLITITTKGGSWVYDGQAHSMEEYTQSGLAEGETLHLTFPKVKNVLDSGKNMPDPIVIKHGERDVTHNYEIEVVTGELLITSRPIVIETGSKEWVYDGKLHSYKEFTAEKEGEDRGLLSCDEITARGFTEIVYYGSEQNKATFTFLCGEEDVTNNYKVEEKWGTLRIVEKDEEDEEEEKPKETYTIKPVDLIKTYDGTPLTYGDGTLYKHGIEGADDASRFKLESLFKQGYYYEAVISGSQTEIGVGESKIESFVLYTPRGTVYTNYEWAFETGKLTVTDGTVVTVHPYAVQKVYNGQRQSYKANDFWVEAPDKSYTVEWDLSSIGLTNAGTISPEEIKALPYAVYKDGVDVTDEVCFNVDTTRLFTVVKRSITVTAASQSKVYDGEKLENSSCSITEGSIADGEHFTATATGWIVDIGSEENEVTTITIVRGEGADAVSVMDNYEITRRSGLLVITE